MRRFDIVKLVILTSVIIYSWSALKPPAILPGPLDAEIVASYKIWLGPISAVKASSGESDPSPAVKGVSTDLSVGNITAPTSLLPVEQYYGPPLVYTLPAMLKSLNLSIDPADIVQVFPDPALGRGSKITVYRATPVEVTDWSKKRTYKTWAKTVGDFLAERSIEIGENDRLEPAANSQLKLGDDKVARVVITRVAVTEVKLKEKIAFKVVEKEDPDLPRGKNKITPGVAGERLKIYRVTRENGLEVKRELLSDEVTKEPSPELRVIGTKVIIGKSYTGRASWYKYNSTRVASDHFKRGTNLRITNLNNGKVIFVTNDGCICADTGYIVDLHPDHFTALGGTLGQGVLQQVKVDEILN